MERFWSFTGLLLCLPFWLLAQDPPTTVNETYYTPTNITGFEYRFDDQTTWTATTGSVTARGGLLTPFEMARRIQTLSINGFSAGFHRIIVRTVDAAGNKGMPKVFEFYVPPPTVSTTIANAEYSFNGLSDSPSTTNVTNIANIARVTNRSLSLDGFPTGFHNIYVRLVDNNGLKGIPKRFDFYIPEAPQVSPINTIEYFVGRTDPGIGNGKQVTASNSGTNVVASNLQIPLTDLPSGFHTFNFRVRDASGSWSTIRSSQIYIPQSTQTSPFTVLEYFVGNVDPGQGNGKQLNASNGNNGVIASNLEVSLADLPSGFHTFNFRVGDESGSWSTLRSSQIYIPEPIAASDNITEVEFFTSAGTLPSPGEGTAMTAVRSFDSTFVDVWSITKITAPPGTLQVYARAKAQSGQWGVPLAKQIEVTNQRVVEGYLSVDGSRVGGRAVNLTGPNDFTATIDSRAEEPVGFFQFTDLEAGQYTLVAQGQRDPANNILASSERVTITLGDVPDVKEQNLSIGIPAYVSSVFPRANATDIELDQTFRLRYTDALVTNKVSTSTVTMNSNLRGKMPITVSLSNSDSVIVVTSSKSFLPNEVLTLSVSPQIEAVNSEKILPFQQKFWVKSQRFDATSFNNADVSADSIGFRSIQKLITADFNNDDLPDLAYVTSINTGVDEVSIVYNLGNKTFGNRRSIEIDFSQDILTNQATNIFDLIASDINQDGNMDLVLVKNGIVSGQSGSQNNKGVFVHIRNNGNSLSVQQKFSFEDLRNVSFFGVYDAQVVDINMDGLPDLAYQFLNEGLRVHLNSGTGVFSDGVTFGEARTTSGSSALAYADLTGDGAPDLIDVNYFGAMDARFFPYEGSFLNLDEPKAFGWANSVTYDAWSFDQDGDGKNDLFLYGSLNLRFGANTSNFDNLVTPGSATTFLTVGNLPPSVGNVVQNTIQPVQISNDRAVEFMYVDQSNNIRYMTWSEQQSQFGNAILFSGKQGNTYREMAIADFDGDGHSDIAYGTVASNQTASLYGEIFVRFSGDQIQSDPAQNLFFSEYIEGLSNNKALEIYNASDVTVALADYRIMQSTNGGGWATYHTFKADASIEAGGTYVLITNQVAAHLFAAADADEVLAFPSPIHFNGDDARAIIHIAGNDTTMLDVFGDPDNDPGVGWTVGSIAEGTKDHTLVRKPTVMEGNTTILGSFGTDDFSSEWIVKDPDDFSDLGKHTFGAADTSASNSAPILVETIGNITINVGDNGEIPIDNLFTDPDDGDVLTFSVSSSNENAVTVSISSNPANSLAYLAKAAGTATITLTATDNAGAKVSTSFSIFVTEVQNLPPIFVDNSDDFVRPKTVLLEDNPVIKLKLTNFFSDPDSDPLTFTVSTSNSAVASAVISADTLITTGLAVGSSIISVTARDGKGGQVAASFLISVNSESNSAPILVGSVSNISITVGDNGGFQVENLFNDPDEGDVLTFSATSSNENVATVSIIMNEGNSLAYSGVSVGTSTITLTAEDNHGAKASTSFSISVTEAQNLPPTVLVTFTPDSVLATTQSPMIFNLYNFFSDDRNALTFEAFDVNTNATAVSISNSTMTVTAVAEGISQFRVIATDDAAQSVSLFFIIRVVELPVVDNRIVSIDMVTQSSDVGFPLSLIFPNHQGFFSTYSISIESSNNSIGIAYASGTQIFFRAQAEGVAIITVKGTRNINGVVLESDEANITLRIKNRVFPSQSSNSSASFYSSGIVVQKWGLLSIPGSISANTPLEIFDELGSSDGFRLFDLAPNNGEPVFNGYEDVTQKEGNPFLSGKGLWFKTLATSSPFTLETPAGARINQRSVLSESFIGYAFISTPYDIESYWIRNNTGINVQLWSFDPDEEAWVSVTEDKRLKPWTAYVAFAPVSTSIVHYLDNFKTVEKQLSSEQFSSASAAWKTQIVIDNTHLSFGDISGAETSLDNYDRALPLPSPNQEVTPPAFVVNGLYVSDDFRTPKSDVNEQILDYRVLNLSAGKHTISANFNESNPNEHALLLSGDSFRQFISAGDSLTINLAKDTRYKVYSGPVELLEELVVPETITLFPAYPNPFNPTTTLRFSIPAESTVSLEVYDVLGRKVATLVNEMRSAGFHTVTFDATSLSSGIYMYRLSSGGNNVLVRKMTLIK